MESVSLIDFSSEDDLLIPLSSQEFENYYCFNCPESEAASTLGAEYTERVSKQMVQASVLSESPQQKRRRSDRFSMRKSLAWDSEFFTSEGVLNPEELAIINCTYNKAVGITLPGIDEELCKSTESASTLNSGNCALENLEVHLFKNLKASIQKSLVDSTQAANKLLSCKTEGQRKTDVPRMKTLKKLDVTSQTMLKLPTMLKRHGTRQQQESTSNDGIVDVKLAASGDCEAKTSSKPLKVLPKTIPLPAMGGKSGYSVTKQIKSNREKAFPGTTAKRQPILTLSRSNNDQGITCRSIPSKASSSCTPRADFILVAASCSSSSNLASSPSDSKNSSSLVTKRNAERNNSSSRLFRKTPARPNRSRPGSTEGSSLSNSAKSTLALSKVSPTSSINIFPKVSSSQKSTTKPRFSKSLESFDGELSSSSSIAVSSGNGGSQKSGALSRSLVGNNSKINLKFDADTKDATSLGLRMPRPRIGYFDKEKTPVGSSDKYLQTSLKKSYVKNTGINETAAATKRKHSNLPFIRAGAHLYPSTNQTSKSAEAQIILHKNLDKHQELSPKVKKEAYLKSSKGNSKLNFREAGVAAVRAESNWPSSPRKKEQPNLLQPKHVAMANETHPTAEQRIDDQSCVMHAQQEHVQSGLNVAVRSTEKENLCPASKAGYESKAPRAEHKAPRAEDDHKVVVAMLGNLVSSLSLSEMKDVITRD